MYIQKENAETENLLLFNVFILNLMPTSVTLGI